MTEINQKEYLKKYLGIGKAPGEKRKKKKKLKGVLDRVKIIDDDANTNSIVIEDDPFQANENEDAPQIVAIIDERPPSLRVDEKTKSHLWQPIGSVDADAEHRPVVAGFKIEKLANAKASKNASLSYENVTVKTEAESPPRRGSEDDYSPPRKRKENDFSPPRRNRRDEDSSPVRSRVDDDYSPPRKSRKNDDYSPPRKSTKDDDYSPRRKNRRKENYSPPRRSRKEDNSPPRRKLKESERPSSSKKSRWSEDTGESSGKLEKTLDGKRAGLQNARQLVEETKQYREREDKLFKNLSKDVSGENAATVRRDRKTGRVRNLEEEDERRRKKEEEEAKNQEKYARWGRGLAQVESREQKIQEELHEMSKPLARYADDEDLEKYLKEQEREGDPMLAYIRKKKRKQAAKEGKVEKPQFEGEFMPNRFGIRPGHRWDGVDRSSGYEKRWFEVQNARSAQLEDTYKWSTEDM